jgi:RimJ/RimL family protein N-acetyltransferase
MYDRGKISVVPMIQELEKRDFPKIEGMISSKKDYPEVLSIVLGVNPGRIFIDDVVKPGAALIWSQGIEGFYLVGDARSPSFSRNLDRFVDRVIAPQAQCLGIDWFEVSGDRSEWDEAIGVIFTSRSIMRSRQCVYKVTGNSTGTELFSSKAANDVRRLDADLISAASLHNHQFLRSKLGRFWRDDDRFLSTGIGYAIIHEQAVASLCLSAFVAGGIHVMDIETTPAQRRKGFARLVAEAFLRECLARHLQPHWECMSDNHPSRRLAESLGFKKAWEYTLHSFRLEKNSS